MAYHRRGLSSCAVLFAVIVSVTCRSSPAETEPSYEGFQVLRLQAENEDNLLDDTVQRLRQKAHVDVWTRTRRSADVMVAPEHLRYVRETSVSHGIRSDVVIDDVQRFLEQDFDRRQNRRHKRAVRDVTNSYLTFDEINAYLQNVASTASAADVTLSNVGRSFENKVVPLVELRGKTSKGNKKAVLIDAGIHAREWMAVAMAMNIIHKLAFNPDSDPEVTDLLEKFDWFVVPCVNPDGYVYSHSTPYSRLWRKTRTTQYHFSCKGVDGNRNFGYDWNPNVGGSTDPCQEVYAGPRSFSEPETRNIRDWLTSHKARGAAYISMHAFGEWLLYPYGSDQNKFLADKDLIESVAKAFQTKLTEAGHSYAVGNSARLLYAAAGGSDDYAKGALGFPVSFTLEMSPKTQADGGFQLAENQVFRVAQDTWAGIKAMTQKLYDNASNNNHVNNNNSNNINYNSNNVNGLVPIYWYGTVLYVDPNDPRVWLQYYYRNRNAGK